MAEGDPPFVCIHCGWATWPDDVWLALIGQAEMVICAFCHDYIVEDVLPPAPRLRRRVETVLRGIQVWPW